MAIVGVGVDIAEVNRIRHLMERYGERFLRRVFCDEELAYCQQFADPLPHLAARWAAKEAIAKALATGFTQGVTWKSICVVNHFWGEPAALLRDGLCAAPKSWASAAFGFPFPTPATLPSPSPCWRVDKM
jgi:holo-[acyl-carrier protein] synthase